MPIRTVKQYSDRGSIKNIAKPELVEQDMPLTPSEARIQKLYDYAKTHNDKDLELALGFITTNYITDKNAIPLSIYRIRQIVDDIKSKSPDKINGLAQEFSSCFGEPLSQEAMDYLSKKRIKTASVNRTPFRRVIKK